MSFFKKLFGIKDKKETTQEVDISETLNKSEAVGSESQESTEEVIEKEAKQKQEELKEALEEELRENTELVQEQQELKEEIREEIQVLEEVKEELQEKVEELQEQQQALYTEIINQEEVVQQTEEVTEYLEEVVHQEEEVTEHLEEVVRQEEEAVEYLKEVEQDDVKEALQEVVEDIALDEVLQDEAEVGQVVEDLEESREEEKPKKGGFFKKLFAGLEKTRNQFIETVDDVLKGFKKIDEDLFEELEEVLIMADFGVETTLAIIEALREKVKTGKLTEPEELKKALQEIITEILTANQTAPIIVENQPNVVLVIGVNGVGKTTTIGKLSHQLKEDGKKVVVAAADTFRAAAIEQLQIWADRAQVDLIKQNEGSDPASVVYDGIQAAKSRQADVLICDTAGRLQNKTNLMKELEKIGRIIEREYPEAHKEVLIVLDATTGQNAISQVKVFKEVAKVDGIVLTKLDGTAKGGAIVGICQSMQVPVKYIGVGEQIDDLQPFDAASFARALFEQEKK